MSAQPALVRPSFASDLEPRIALWISRLGAANATAAAQVNDGLYSEELRRLVGVSPYNGTFNKTVLRRLLRQRAEEFEHFDRRAQNVLERNIAMLGQLIGLDRVDVQILLFTALSRLHTLLSEVLEGIPARSHDYLVRVLQHALRLDAGAIRESLRPGSLLRTTRLLSIDHSVAKGIQLELPEGLQNALLTPASNIRALMAAFIESAPPPSLNQDAFVHLADETALLTAYLTRVCRQRTPGVNILIYGEPGTGKTEYVRWLAGSLHKVLYQVRATDNHGDVVSGFDRLAYFQLSQRFLQNSDALILFDEIEDVFPQNGLGDFGPFIRRNTSIGKLFINTLLETNRVPAIWITNAVGHIDKAYLRRFDFSFEMGIPPLAARRDIVAKYLRGYRISSQTLHYLAQQEELSPAQIEKAAKVLRLSGRSNAKREAVLLQVIENSMALLEQHKKDAVRDLADGHYQLDLLNPDCDLQRLTEQLKQAPNAVGALCLYGPPGTGKTAFAHFLARETERPLLIRRASDILGPYVGETEQKIAAAFRDAKDANAILLIDEADSLLRDRRNARNAWEVSAVNEMLTQMERFAGLFICSTNLMHDLDTASLRRFALKIKFDYLTSEQRWRLFVAHAPKLPKAETAIYRQALNTLNNLTPGDFATIRRQATLLHLTLSADDLLHRLTQESRAKGDAIRRPIGFIRTP